MAKLRQASLIMLLLLAVSSAALAETCTGGGECPSGWILFRQYGSPNCTGDFFT